MKALVINLNSATERMEFQRQQLDSLAIDFQRLPAYEINSSEDEVYQRYYDTWQRPMSISEVSCFFSHKNAWDQVIEENQAMLILEDDALLAKNVTCILKELSTLKNIDFVELEERSNRKRLLARSNSGAFCKSFLIRLYQGRSGSAGYVIWPSGAKKLLKKMEDEGIGIADKFINTSYSLKSFQIEPAPILQLDQCQLYGLKSPLKVRTSISSKAETTNTQPYFRVRRMIGELKIGLNLLRHFHHANRRKIQLSDQFEQDL